MTKRCGILGSPVARNPKSAAYDGIESVGGGMKAKVDVDEESKEVQKWKREKDL